MIDNTIVEKLVENARRLFHSPDNPNPFVAIIAIGNEIICEADNRVYPGNDPTAHAEVMAIRAACRKLETPIIPQCTLYTSCEPCAMCFSAAWWAGIREIYYVFPGMELSLDTRNAGFYRMFSDLIRKQDSIAMKKIHAPAIDDLFRQWHPGMLHKIKKVAYENRPG
uniref:tRNA(Arg) A34 adenosine deaminase TadA n=1 Tax=Candidatus Kentrum sp. LPFa TaxID=2126335 RepID=A0A450WB54_9GAMM|nr:MAG: tRNA(Arg) A34 adenosine deaminase TadA [Candidatus Kentron sp. LPFa]VFK30153.1 MAG: tRNA(Arg) A34 adenosine deaminase TadA [Candidatus Kentron sp. LPFa]